MATYYNRVVLLAPCTLTRAERDTSLITGTKIPGLYTALTGLDIWKIGGDGWTAETATICANLSQEYCDWAGGYDESVTYSLKLNEHPH